MTQTNFTRRQAMAASAASALAAGCSGPSLGTGRRVAVVGGGIVGASIAHHLAKGGAQVILLERHELATRASRGTFAWLNASWAKQPRHYHRLNQLGLAGWKQLESELDLPIKWTGSIEWFGSEQRQQKLADQIAEQVEWGEPARMVELAQLEQMEPNVSFGGTATAALSPNDAALDPVLATRKLVESAINVGAEVKTNCEVTGHRLSIEGASVLETSCGEVVVDTLVLATGADAAATLNLAGIEIPQRTTPGVIAITEPIEPLINSIIVAPGVHIHQRLDGRVVLGEQDGAPQNDAHAGRLADRPNAFPAVEIGQQHAQRILNVAAQYVPRLSAAKVEDVYIGWRPLPLDGHPVIGFSPKQPNAYLAISHSGVSLAPVIGKMAAQEILNSKSVDALEPYRPDRDFAEVRRY